MKRSYWMKALSAAALIMGMAPPLAEAQAQQRQVFQVSPGPRIVTQELPGLNDRAAIQRWLCPNGGRPMRGRPGRCDGRGVARGGGGADTEVAGWHNDLPPPTHRQLACPEGTVPTEARANPGTVRCMPGAAPVTEAAAPTPGAQVARAEPGAP
jgi:hypothetical protein